MKKKILRIARAFILSIALLYTLNVLLSNINIFVPINMYTILIGAVLGPFGVVSLVIMSYLVL